MTYSRWLITLPLLGALTGCNRTAADAPEEKPEPHVTVRTAAASLRTISTTLSGFGQCEALLNHLATLTPAVEGHVHALLAQPGAELKAGDPVLELDPTVAEADFAEKSAARDTMKAALDLLVSKPRDEEQKISKLAIEQNRVAAARAKALLDRTKHLRETKDVAEPAVIDAQQALAQAELQQQSSEAQFHVQMIGPRSEAVAEAEAKVKAAEGAVTLAKAHLDLHTIRSPIDGTLDSLTCHPGQTLAIGTPVGEVVDSHQVYALVWLPARFARQIHPGQKARVLQSDTPRAKPGSESNAKAESSPSEEDSLTGEVAMVGQVVDAQTGNIPVRVLVDNGQGRLAIGQTLEVTITVEEKEDVLAVPAAAVFDLGEGPVVCVVRDGKAKQLHPEASPPNDGWVPVTGTDLKAGEAVIIEGGFNLPDGAKVTIASESKDATPKAGTPKDAEPHS